MFYINAAEINSIINIVLIVLFALAIAGFVFAIIRGIYRGVWKSTFYLAWYATLILAAVFTLQPLIDAVGSTDLSQLGYYLNISSGEETYSIAVTSIKQTLHDAIACGLTINGMGGSASVISERAWVLAVMILKFVIFLVDIILILILGTFFGWLLWVILFKRLIPKVVRKRVKLRVVAALEEAVLFVILTGLFISPLTSIVNIANQAWQRSNHTSEDETVQMIDGFMDTYNDSLFAKTFFNWTVDENGLTIDAKVLNEVTKSTAEDVSLSMIETIDGLGEVGAIVAGALVNGENGSPIDMGYMLSQETLTQVFSALNRSQIITYALPVAATLAFNLPQVAEIIDPKVVDLSDIDWLTELQNVETVIIDVISSGLIDDFITPEQQPIDPESKQQIDVNSQVQKMLSENAYPYITRLFTSIDSSKLLKKVIPSIMLYLSDSNPMMADMMPQTWEEMNLLNWGSELNIVYDNLFRLNKAAPELVETLLASGNAEQPNPEGPIEPEKPKEATDPGQKEPNSNEQPDIMELVIDNIDAFARALIGEFDENGQIINVDSYGRTQVYDKNGKKIPGRYYTLMDSSLFSYLFPSLLKQLTNTMGQGENPFIKAETLEKAFDKLNSGSVLKNYKKELASLFTAFKGVMSNKTLKEMITNPNGNVAGTDQFMDPEFVNSMVNILPAFKQSEIFKIAVEPFMVSQITSQTEMLKQVGLKAENITNHLNEKKKEAIDDGNEDSYYDYFFNELSFLLKQMPNMLEISNMMSQAGSDSNALFDKLYTNVDKLAGLLDAVYESDILNPENKRNVIEGNNFFDILTHLFGGETPLIDGLSLDFKEMQEKGFLKEDCRYISANGSNVHKWTNTKTKDGQFMKDAYGHPIFDGETGYLANVLVSLGYKSKTAYIPDGQTKPLYEAGSTLVSVLTSGTVDVSKIVGRLDADFGISKVFAAVDDSTLFSSMFGPFLDSKLQSTGLIKEGEMSFANVKDWTSEGNNFAAICNSIDQAGIDLSNLDINKVNNIPALNIMLHSLADSQLFENVKGEDYSYTFNSFLFSKLEDALGSGQADMLADPFTKQEGETITHNRSMEYFDINPETGKSAITSKDLKSQHWVNSEWMDTFIKYSSDKDGLNKALENAELKQQFYDSDYIAKTCNVLETLNKTKADAEKAWKDDTDVNKPTSFDSNDINALMSSGYASSENLDSMLKAVYYCTPVKMVLYNAIDSLGSVELNGIDLSEINSEFFIYEGEKGWPESKLETLEQTKLNELSNFVKIYDKLMTITKDLGTGSNADFNELLKDKSNMVVLNETLQMMNESYILHRAGKAVKHHDFATNKDTYHENTVFQTLVQKFTLSDMILQELYRSDSPKDIANFEKYKAQAMTTLPSNYVFKNPLSDDNIHQLALAKGKLLLEDVFPVPKFGNEEASQSQLEEVSKIIEISSSLLGGYKNLYDIMTVEDDKGNVTAHYYDVIDNIKVPHAKSVEEEAKEHNLSKLDYCYAGLPSSEVDAEGNPIPTMDFSHMDYTKITGNNIKLIIQTINDSNLLFDLAPNALKEVFSSLGTAGSGQVQDDDFFSAALQKADPYYLYRLAKTELGLTKDEDIYNIRFYRDGDGFKRSDINELDNIAGMIDTYTQNMSSDGKGNNIFADGLTPEVINFTEGVLESLSNSYIFHKGKMLGLTNEQIKNRFVDPSKVEPSSFESLFGEFYIMTGITQILDIDHNKQNEITALGREQLMQRIYLKTYNDTILNDADVVDKGISEGKNKWTDEITVMCNLAREVSATNVTNMGGFNIDLDKAGFAPDTVANLLTYMNHVDTCEGAINNIVKTALDSAGFNQFTSYTNTANKVADSVQYNLTPAQYGGVLNDGDCTVKSYSGEIKNIHTLLNNLYDAKTQSYQKLSSGEGSNPIRVFIDNGKSSDILLNFLHDSNLFNQKVNNVKGLAEGKVITAESIFFYNLMDKATLTQFISGEGIAKLNTIDWIMHGYEDTYNEILYSPENEAYALDTLVRLSDSFTDGNFQFDNLSESKDIVRAVIGSLTRVVTFEGNVPTVTDAVHSRSYLSSEIISSILDNFMDELLNTDLHAGQPGGFDLKYRRGFNAAASIEKINKSSYDLLNMTEANAVVSILDVYENNLVKTPGGEIDGAATGKKLVDFFLKPSNEGGMDWSLFMYEGGKQNSYIASVVYASKINPIITDHLGSVEGSLNSGRNSIVTIRTEAIDKRNTAAEGLVKSKQALAELEEQLSKIPVGTPGRDKLEKQRADLAAAIETAESNLIVADGKIRDLNNLVDQLDALISDVKAIALEPTDLFANTTIANSEPKVTFGAYGTSIKSLLVRINEIQATIDGVLNGK